MCYHRRILKFEICYERSIASMSMSIEQVSIGKRKILMDKLLNSQRQEKEKAGNILRTNQIYIDG